jgi:hypothetical protein
LSPTQLIQCCSKSLQISRPDLELPDFDCNVSMSARYKVASQIAQAITVFNTKLNHLHYYGAIFLLKNVLFFKLGPRLQR